MVTLTRAELIKGGFLPHPTHSRLTRNWYPAAACTPSEYNCLPDNIKLQYETDPVTVGIFPDTFKIHKRKLS